MIGQWRPAIVLGAFGLLSGAVFARLRQEEWSLLPASALGATVLMQPSLLSSALGLRAALFGLATLAVGYGAISLTERQDPRRIVFLGGSLAGAQLVDPMCGAVATLVVPLVLQKTIGSPGGAKTLGFWISLIFIPALVGALLMYFALRGGLSVARWRQGIWENVLRPSWTPVLILLSAAPLAIGLQFYRQLNRTSALAWIAASVVCAGIVFSGFAGADELALSEIACSALLMLAISVWPKRSTRMALLLGIANSAWAWALFFVVAE